MEDYLKKEYSKKWFDMILKIKDKIPKFGIVGFNLNLTNEIVLDNLNEDWDWYVLMNFNKNITIKKDLPKNYFIINYGVNPSYLCFEIILSLGTNLKKIKIITSSDIIELIDSDVYNETRYKSYFWTLLSMNENLTLKIIKNNLDKSWGCNAICHNNLEYDCKNYIAKCTKNVLLTKILKAKKIS